MEIFRISIRPCDSSTTFVNTEVCVVCIVPQFTQRDERHRSLLIGSCGQDIASLSSFSNCVVELPTLYSKMRDIAQQNGIWQGNDRFVIGRSSNTLNKFRDEFNAPSSGVVPLDGALNPFSRGRSWGAIGIPDCKTLTHTCRDLP